MIIIKSQTPGQTKQLITEMETKIKFCEGITGEALSDLHMKSVLLGFIDPTTRAHTTQFQGAGALFIPLSGP